MHSPSDFSVSFSAGGNTVLVGAVESPLETFRKAQRRIVVTRTHLWKYNALICALLVVISLSRQIRACRRRRRGAAFSGEGFRGEDSASDSGSTLLGATTPPSVKRDHDGEDEQSPLLSRRSYTGPRSFWSRISCQVQAALMYQPRPLPYINKTLPDNATTLFILAFASVNLVLCTVYIPYDDTFWMVLGDRCANLFSANLPLLYLLAAKNQPLKYLTGFSYEGLNVFHRRLGELLCLFAFVHMGTTLVTFYAIYQPVLHNITLWRFINERLILMGILAFICYETLYFTSLGSFRHRWYEIFLASHILLQAGGLAFLYFHFYVSQLYVLSAVTIFLVDRLLFRLMVNTTTMRASVDILEDGETVMLSADWAISSTRPLFVGRRSIKHGWQPAEHVFVTIPALSKSAVLQAHPFTIASGAPDLSAAEPYAWLNLLIRAHDGFSRDLLRHAQSHSKVDVRFDGPYGSLEPLRLLEDSDNAVLVAGGSGIAVVFPLMWALLHHPQKPQIIDDGVEGTDQISVSLCHQRQKKLSLIWVIHSASHRSWLPQGRLDELIELGLDVQITPPTATHGRPDVGAILREMVWSSNEQEARSTGVVVSGPDALNRDVRNTCSRLVGDGLDVQITVEKFGW